jgi:hypothetical protein
MRGDRAHGAARLRQAPLQLAGEEQVGQLGLAVDAPAVVAVALPVEVVEAHPADPVRARGDGHDAAGDVPQQEVGQREVPEVVGAELRLEAVDGLGLRHRHDPGVVDEDVEVAAPAGGERAHRVQRGEVERTHLPVAGEGRGDALALGGVAHRQDDVRAGPRQLARGDGAEAARRARHDHGGAGEVGQVGGGPGGGRHAGQCSRCRQRCQ